MKIDVDYFNVRKVIQVLSLIVRHGRELIV